LLAQRAGTAGKGGIGRLLERHPRVGSPVGAPQRGAEVHQGPHALQPRRPRLPELDRPLEPGEPPFSLLGQTEYSQRPHARVQNLGFLGDLVRFSSQRQRLPAIAQRQRRLSRDRAPRAIVENPDLGSDPGSGGQRVGERLARAALRQSELGPG
jgi:hypothetical protein